jgi:molecular chaperone GrpE
LDQATREKLLSRFVAYLDGLDHDESAAVHAAAEEAREEADLFSVFVELAGLRNEVRTQSRLLKEALDQFRGVFDTLQASHATLEQELKRARAGTTANVCCSSHCCSISSKSGIDYPPG